MSVEQDKVRTLAERVAQRLAMKDDAGGARGVDEAARGTSDELGELRATLGEVQARLARIESRVTNAPAAAMNERQLIAPPMQAAHTPPRWLSGTYVPAVHPSEDRFGVGEAISELVEHFERENMCNMEPGDKPCDHCGVCSARGF